MQDVYCRVQYSRAALAFLVLAVGGTLGLVVLLPYPHEVRAACFAFVIAAACHAEARIGAVEALHLDCERSLSVCRGGTWHRGELRDGSFVAPWLTVLRWRPHGARFDRHLLILPDMADADALRRVRVIARWG